MPTGWSRFSTQVQKDARLWLALVALLALGRILAFGVHFGRLSNDSGLGTVLTGLWSGLRFDVQCATLMTLPSLVLSVLCCWWTCDQAAERVRRWWGATLVATTVVVVGIDVGYIGEYGNQFDQFLFGLLFDDVKAILLTIWQSYPVIWAVLGMIGACVGLGWLLIRWLRSPFIAVDPASPAPRWWVRILLGVAMVVLVGAGARGSFQRLPLQNKAAAMSADPLVNALTPTPYHALRKAIELHLQLQHNAGLEVFLPDHDLVKAGAVLFPGHGAMTDIDQWMVRTAPGAQHPPKQVFLLVMESYDAWSFAAAYRSLGLTDQVRALGQEGLLFTSFVAASTGTMASLSALLTGLPDVGVHTAWRPMARQPFPSSPAAIFKRLGYRTRFFYSGYLSWERIGDFCKAQGFDEVHGGGSIDGGRSGNEWGVDDEHLLRYVTAHVPTEEPSFNVILSTSYHPPFNVDVYGHGFPLRTIPPDLASRYDGRITLAMFGHQWYSDVMAMRFIRGMEERVPGSLFALTGDHWSRRFLNGTPTFAERSLMPLLLYGPAVLPKGLPLPHTGGSHLDIAPTLVELCAPMGFTYQSLGENLLAATRGLGFGVNSVVGPDFIADMGGEQVIFHPLPDRPLPAILPDGEQLRQLHRAWHGLGWWRLMHGNLLTDDGSQR